MLIITDRNGISEPLAHFKDLELNDEVNGDFSLTFTTFSIPQTSHVFPLIQEESIVEWEGYEFRIRGFTEVKNSKLVRAPSTFFDTIDNPIDQLIGGNKTIQEAAAFAMAGSGWTYEIQGDYAQELLFNFGNSNTLAMMKELCKTFNCELQILPGRHIVLSKQIGTDEDFQFRYKHNIQALKREVNTDNLTTAIKGYGANGLEVEYRSPNVAIYGLKYAEPISDDRFTVAEHLMDHIKQSLNDVPEVSIDLEELDLGEPRGLGDKVWLIYEPLGIEFQTRILARKLKPYQKGRSVYTIGNIKPKISDILTETRIEVDENKREFRSKIEQTNEKISLEVKRLDGDLEEAFSKIELTSDRIELIVSETGEINGENIASSISISPTAIDILSNSINLTGKVTFSSFDSSMQDLITNTEEAATDALDRLIELSESGAKTIINGGNIVSGTITGVNFATITDPDSGKLTITGSILKTEKYGTGGQEYVVLRNGQLEIRTRSDITGTLQTVRIDGNLGFLINSNQTPDASMRLDYYETESDALTATYRLRAWSTDENIDKVNLKIEALSDLKINTKFGNLYWNGQTVATRNWVLENAAGYQAGDSAYFGYVNSSGNIDADGQVWGYTVKATSAVYAGSIEIGNGTHFWNSSGSVYCAFLKDYGNATIDKNLTVSGTFSNPSDQRLKCEVSDFETDALKGITDLNYINFNYHWDDLDAKSRIGFFAQEAPVEIIQEDEYGILSYDVLSTLSYNMVATKQLNLKVENKFAEYEAQIQSLQKRVEELSGKVS
ncbi:phage tail spike protein [Peribacillus sp. SCS-26]|uniref:phage tail spike protein n=1 Tax=Paraperibacillus marinus TaxID=3115295 RepID=UPI003906C6C3